MAVVLGIIFILLTLAGIGLGVFLCYGVHKNGASKSKIISIAGSFVFALAMLVCFITVPFGLKTVNTGEVGVLRTFGEAKESRDAGLHFVNVFTTDMIILDTKVQQLEVRTEVYTQDAQSSTVELIVQFKIDPTKAIDIVKNYGSISMLSTRVEKVSIEKAKVVLSSKTAMKLIETRSELSPTVQDSIMLAQEQYYIIIESVVITDMTFSDAFETAVEEKMIAEQKKLESEYEKEKAIIKAEEELAVAKLNAEKALAEAKGLADAEVAVAEGAAKALKIQYIETARMLGLPVSETEVLDDLGNVTGYEYEIDTASATTAQYKILEDYMRYINYLSTWDGELPQVIGDGSSLGGIIIQP